jgi:hypothetical protein
MAEEAKIEAFVFDIANLERFEEPVDLLHALITRSIIVFMRLKAHARGRYEYREESGK